VDRRPIGAAEQLKVGLFPIDGYIGEMATRSSSDTGLMEKTKPIIAEPPRYSCLLHNDHFTTREFVVYVLMSVFLLKEADAQGKMLEVHKQGKGRVGNYSYDIARTKANQTEKLARDNDFPLKCTVEPM
jgi:ATP-dependent Clp protease adaptor protein ClpS